LVAQNLKLPQTRDQVQRLAELHDGGIKLDEHRRRLSTELRITVTGMPQPIQAFRDSTAGDAGSPNNHNLLDMLVSAALDALTRATQRRRRARTHQRQGPEHDETHDSPAT